MGLQLFLRVRQQDGQQQRAVVDPTHRMRLTVATWWIPLLLILGDWRHVVKHVPLTYHPAYCAMVFSLAMYTAATFQPGSVLRLPFLLAIPRLMIFVALVAWTIVFAGMVAGIGRRLFFSQPR
jgi:tellurite resistance protein TehA-like permease